MTDDETDKLQEEEPKRRNRGGRPRKINARRRPIMVRLTDDEYETLFEIAKERGIAEYLRATGLNEKPKLKTILPEINTEAWIELARTAGNLNQLAHHANEGQVVSTQLKPVLNKLYKEIIILREALQGKMP